MVETNSVVQLVSAVVFAAAKHTAQKRKGERQEPYVNHVIEVASLLAEATSGEDVGLIIAGLLHDTVEDTETTPEEIEATFGREVRDLVVAVTDDKRLPKQVRKLLQVERAARKSDRAKLLKIADKISNLRALASSPPADWDHGRKVEYFEWAKAVVSSCRGVNPALEQTFDEAYRTGLSKLSQVDPAG